MKKFVMFLVVRFINIFTNGYIFAMIIPDHKGGDHGAKNKASPIGSVR